MLLTNIFLVEYHSSKYKQLSNTSLPFSDNNSEFGKADSLRTDYILLKQSSTKFMFSYFRNKGGLWETNVTSWGNVFGWYQQWYHSNRYQVQYLLTRPFLSQPVALCQHTEETHQPLLKVLCNCTLHAEMIMGLTMHMMMQITQAQNRLQSLYLSQEHHFSTPLAYPLPIMSLLYCDMLYSNHPQLYLFYPKLQTMVRGVVRCIGLYVRGFNSAQNVFGCRDHIHELF